MQGRFCRVEPLDLARHAPQLHEAFAEAPPGSWTYLPEYMGPHATAAARQDWFKSAVASDDPLWHAIVDARTGGAVGISAFLRIDPNHGVIEVGGVLFSPRLQRHRSDVSDAAPGLRRTGLSPLRMEMRQPERAVPRRGVAVRIHI
jgi:RimJ/RimL family protein N-acetyltransferase